MSALRSNQSVPGLDIAQLAARMRKAMQASCQAERAVGLRRQQANLSGCPSTPASKTIQPAQCSAASNLCFLASHGHHAWLQGNAGCTALGNASHGTMQQARQCLMLRRHFAQCSARKAALLSSCWHTVLCSKPGSMPCKHTQQTNMSRACPRSCTSYPVSAHTAPKSKPHKRV